MTTIKFNALVEPDLVGVVVVGWLVVGGKYVGMLVTPLQRGVLQVQSYS